MQTFMKAFIKEIIKNRYLYLLALPALLFLAVFAYLPLFGHILAFKDYKLKDGILGSKWVGFDNFKFFFGGPDWLYVTFNTLFLNSLFLGFGLTFALLISIFINDIKNVVYKKITQSFIFLPYFISWLVVYFMVFIVLNSSNGLANNLLQKIGLKPVNWYQQPQLWPAILTLIYIWKNAGYNSIIFLAAIAGLPAEVYESATIDGASRFQKVIHITLPMLRHVFIIMLLMGIGRIFYGDFGMIYGIVGDNGVLFPTTDIIDTYTYRALRQLGNFSMSSAVVLYQSIMGLCIIALANWFIRKAEPEAKLF